MRKGRKHNDRQKHNNQIVHRRGGKDGGDVSDDDDNNDDDNNNEATERPWLWYGRPLCASAQWRRWRLVDSALALTTNSCRLVQ